MTPDGEIEYLGRIDTQVKVRGYRIELTEIEAVLLEDAAVANAIVALVSDEGGVDELAAYVVPAGEAGFAGPRPAPHPAPPLRFPRLLGSPYRQPIHPPTHVASHQAGPPPLP